MVALMLCAFSCVLVDRDVGCRLLLSYCRGSELGSRGL